MLDLTTLSGLAKENYLGDVNEHLNHASPFVAQLEKSTADVDGLEVLLDVELGYNAGFGARGENEDYPTGDPADNIQPRWKLAKLTLRDTVSKEAIKRTETDAVSFERAMNTVTRQLKRAGAHDLARQVFGTSDGVVATCGTTSSSTTVVLATSTSSSIMNWLKPNFVVDLGTSASPTSVASARTITAVDRTNKTITISGAAVTTSSTTKVSIAGSGGSTAYRSRELTGLQTIVGTGNLFGVSTTTYPEFVANADSSGSNRALTATLLQKVRDEQVRAGAPVSEDKLFVTTHGVFRTLAAAEAQKVRYTSGEQSNLQAGVEGIKAGGHTVIADQYCPDNTGFSVETNDDGLRLAVNGNWEFEEENGNIFGRLQGKDVYEVLINRFADLVTTSRNCHTLVTQLTES